MPYKQFDRSKLEILPISQREHDINISVMKDVDLDLELIIDEKYDKIAKALINAKEKKATALMMYGAHVIRSGMGPHMIALMEKGLITHFATNGAGVIHDFELALIGNTCESVAKYILNGQFGLWTESGLLNDIIADGVKNNMGIGESVGKYIWENDLPYKHMSVLANGYRLKIPCTSHIGIGNDIIHEHPNANGAKLGEASMIDFLVYTNAIMNLENGVFLNFGSAVTGPEVYLKAVAMCRNVLRQENKDIKNFTTAVFDLHKIDSNSNITPEKSDPRYYFRPWKTILSRTIASGGTSYYIQGVHSDTVRNVAVRALKWT